MAHTHRYTRLKLGKKDNKYVVFKCNLPGCSHYVRKELAEGRICFCNRCNKMMVLTKPIMQLSRPHCAECVKPKREESINLVREFLEGIKL